MRTTTGAYVLQGLTAHWRDDPRVERLVVAVPPGDITLPAGVEPIVLSNGGSWLLHVTREVPRLADRLGANVIFSPNATGPRDARTVLYFQDLFHFRYRDGTLPFGTYLREVGRAAWRSFAAPRSGLGIAVSRAIAEEAKRDVEGLAILEIPNGVDVGGARWSGEEDVVYVAGGTGPHKSEDTAVRAWARLDHRPPATVLEIGGVEPGERRAELQRMARDLHLGDRVVIHGALPREAYVGRIARTRLMVACSQVESFGLPVAEALAIGAPVLCSDIPAHRELLERADAGATFRAGDDASLAAELGRALAGGMPKSLGSAPRGWDWSTRAREHIDAYHAHLNGTSPLTRTARVRD